MLDKKRCLIVAAHPDDEVLGCGGTAARLVKQGCEIFTLILGEGITARDEERDREERLTEINELKEQIKKANEILGVKDVFTYDFPDNRFDQVPILDIVKVIEKVKNDLNLDIIFTHSNNDLNVDHKITFDAVLTAVRPMKEETVKEIYSFEILSSTEWNYPLKFSPNVFVDISETIDLKCEAMNCYKSELREFPHPRSIQGIKINAKNWGMKVGVECSEAFYLVRGIK